MSPRVIEQLDPQPFRDWVDERLGESPEEDAVDRLTFDLGLGERKLRRWRYENASLERIEVEEALHRADVGLWEVYPDLEVEAFEPEPVQPASPTAYLSDAQLYVLHRAHTDRNVSVHRLGDEIWQQAGFASPVSARNAIRVGFRRLGLPLILLGPNALARRCKATTHRGLDCRAVPLRGSDYCRAHHPETRNEVRFHALSISPFVRAAA